MPTNRIGFGTDFVLSNSNVGIGTSSPTKKLHVAGDTLVTGSSTFVGDVTFNSNVSIAGTLTYEDVTNVDSIGIITARNGITIDSGGLSVIGVSTFDTGIFSGNTSTDLVRITQSGSGNALVVEDDTNPDTTPFVVTGDGSVGIGTSSPREKLEISGALIVNTNTSNLLIYNPGTGYSGTMIVNDSFHTALNGKVTGTDGGTGQIVIGGTVIANTAGSNFNILLGYGTTVNTKTEAIAIGHNATAGDYALALGYNANAPDNSAVINVGNSERLRITSTGNVGIGTTNPTEKLDVSGNALFDGEVGIGTTSLLGIVPNGTLQNKLNVYGPVNISLPDTIDPDDVGLRIGMGNTELYNTSTGTGTNAGIWIRNSRYGINGQTSLITFSAVNSGGYFNSWSLGSLATGDANRAGNFIIGSRDTGAPNQYRERLRINAAGNVGIGTTNPTSKLQVAGDTNISGVVTAFDYYANAEYPSVRPSLDLAFAQTKTLDSRITFTRASTATFTDANGVIQTATTNTPRFDHDPSTGESLGLLVEEARTNGFQYSTIFSDSYWNSNANVTVVPNAAAAPDGTFTAQLIIPASGTVNAKVSRNSAGSNGTNRVYTFYVKSNGVQYIAINTSIGSYGSCFDLQTGSLLEPLAGFVASPRIERLPNGWWRISHVTSTGSVPALVAGTSFSRMGGLDTATFDGVSGFYLWGAQWEDSTTFPTSYIPTPATFTGRTSTATYYDANGVIQTAGIGVARSAAYFPDSSGVMRSAGLLLEAAGTNLLLSSEDFASGNWNQGGPVAMTITPNAAVAPDGTTTADKLIRNAGASAGTRSQIITAPNLIGTFSVYAKAGEISTFNLQPSSSSGVQVTFDVSTGIASNPGASVLGYGIQNVGNGWYRCWVTANLNSVYITIETVSPTTGDGTSGLFLWGAQLEASPYPTSYIPTVASTVTRSADVSSSATVTRSADVASITGSNFSSWYNQSEGSFVFSENNSFGGSLAKRFELIQNSSPNSNAIAFTVNYGNGTRISSRDSNTVGSIDRLLSNVWTSGGTHRYGYGLQTNNIVVVSGSNIATSSSGTFPPNLDALDFGAQNRAVSLSNTGGKFIISRLTYWPARLSNNVLQTITL